MPITEDGPRQVVPRWRLFKESMTRGELMPLTPLLAPRFNEEHLAERILDWKESPSLSVAADLVSCAIALGLDRVAADAAMFVISNKSAPAPARNLAAIYLQQSGIDVPERAGIDVSADTSKATGQLLTPENGRQIYEIHRLRCSLRAYPNNPIQWMNLALLYTSAGDFPKARRAVQAALHLAPVNRFVLRSASRFFLHIGERDRAHKLLSRSPSVHADPWILAAEIATADSMQRTSGFIKHARRTMEQRRFDNQQVSELASAIGTLEYKAGKDRDGRKHLAASLLEPSENAIAQAGWIARKFTSNFYLPEAQLKASPEAAAWDGYELSNWKRSLQQALLWQDDQPFSSRPAIHGSFVAATVFEDFAQAKQIAVRGLLSNRSDPTLVNNFVFAATMNGDLDIAIEEAKHLEIDSLASKERIAVLATRGLIAFRSDNKEVGRVLYREAIELARKERDEAREAQAKAYLAMEELRSGTTNATQMCEEAIRLAKSLHSPLGTVLGDMVERRLGREPQSRSESLPIKPRPIIL